jgi:hypothetical protein
VIVHDLNLVGIAVLPAKANSPLIIDTNAVLAGAVTGQFLQAVSRRNPQIGQILGSVKDQ